MSTEKVKQALASLSKTEASRKELASVIVDWIKPNHLTSDVISLFLNTRQLQPGDMLVKKIRKPGVKVRKFVPGTIHLADEIEVIDRINYTLDGHVAKVMANLWDLERGELGTVADMRQDLTQALVDFYAGKVFALLSTVWNAANTPDNYTEVATSLSKTALDTAIDYIDHKAGGVQAIVGVKKTLNPITTFAGYGTYATREQFSDEILTQALRDNWIGQYRGVRNIVGLSQIWDDPESDTALLPEEYVLVIGKNTGEFVTFGDPMTKEWTDMRPTPPYFVLEVVQQWGLIVDMAESMYVIKIT